MELLVSFLGILVSIVVGYFSIKFAKIAALFSKESVEIGKTSAEFARESAQLAKEAIERQKREDALAMPCVGESSWRRQGDYVVGTLTIFPGRHFTQTKAVVIPGYKLSPVRETFINGRRDLYATGQWVDRFPVFKSLVATRDAVQIEFAMSPVPESSFEVRVLLAREEPDILHSVEVTPELHRLYLSAPENS